MIGTGIAVSEYSVHAMLTIAGSIAWLVVGSPQLLSVEPYLHDKTPDSFMCMSNHWWTTTAHYSNEFVSLLFVLFSFFWVFESDRFVSACLLMVGGVLGFGVFVVRFAIQMTAMSPQSLSHHAIACTFCTLAGFWALALNSMTHVLVCGVVAAQPCTVTFGHYVGTLPLVGSAIIQFHYDAKMRWVGTQGNNTLQTDTEMINVDLDDSSAFYDDTTNLVQH
jgi:hypothetical protein